MQVSVEQLEGLERRVTVQVPAETVEKEIQSRLQSLTRNARIDGFRPGKVPLKLIKRRYGDQVRREVVGEIMERSFRDALSQEDLRPAGGPRVEPINLEEGQQLEYRATFEVMPEFTPKSITGRRIVRPAAEVTEADVDAMVEKLRQQNVNWTEVDRPAAQGDRVTLSYHGTIDGAEFEGNKADDLAVTLGDSGMLADFERHLYEQAAGAELAFDLTFPGDYPSSHLAGKTAHFNVTIKTVAAPSLPEVDEVFIESFGIKEGGIAQLRAALKENMERELNEKIKERVKQQVMDALLEENAIQVPQALVEEEITSLAQQTGYHRHDEDAEAEAAEKKRLFEPEAKRRVALGLIVSRLVSANDIELDRERVEQRLATLAASYEDSDEVIRWYRQNPRLMEGVNTRVLEDQVVDWLLNEADVEEQSAGFDEVMRPQQGAAVEEHVHE